MKFFKKFLWLLFPLLIMGASAVWISRSMKESPQEHLRTQVVRSDIRQLIRGIGSLEAEDIHSIQARIPGRLLRVYVQTGEHVRKGAHLFTIENRDIEKDYRLIKAQYRQKRLELKKMALTPSETAVFEAQGALDKASRAVQEMRNALRDKEELYHKGFVSKREMEELKAQLVSAKTEEKIANKRFEDVSTPPPSEEIDLKKAELSKMKIQLNNLKDQWKASKAYASFKALVIEVSKKKGDPLNSEDSVVTLVNTGEPLVIQGMVYESEVSKIKKGQKAFVKVSGSQKPLKARVEDISLIAKNVGSAKKFPIKLLLSEKVEGPLRLGIGADYEILVEEKQQVLALPIQFVIRQSEMSGAWVIQKDKKKFIPLKLGLNDGAFVEIIAGLEEGQEVVLPKA
jgi:multidrug efflux pump subunit AcrA (membrane-fusion protein)